MKTAMVSGLKARGALLLVLGSAVMLAFLPTAEARIDPLRFVTSQIVHPNILIVLDTSGSLGERPETSDFPNDLVGGDCYNGTGVCNPNPLSGTCTDGTACGNPGTCTDQKTPCTPGTPQYCPDGTACLSGRFCGSGAPNQNFCPTTTQQCMDGSACWGLCADHHTVCHSQTDCPQPTCTGAVCTDGTACTQTGGCTVVPSCNSSTWQCTTQAGAFCFPGAWGDAYCAANYPNTCQGACSTGGAACTRASDCTANTCNTSGSSCPISTGSTTCGYWCADHSQCSGAVAYCAGSSGTISACSQCPDGLSCYSTSHCGSASCPSSPQVYKGSSRIAIAKHVLRQVTAENQTIAHFGLMSFNQSTYFPYKSGSSTTQTIITFDAQAVLQFYGGWDWAHTQPLSSWASNGITYTLADNGDGTGNSQYRARGTTVHHNFCGTRCAFNGTTWRYVGSYFSYVKTTITGSGAITDFPAYHGDTYVNGGTTYHYYSFPYDYGNSSYYTANAPVFGLTSSPSQCSDSQAADGVLRVGINTTDDPVIQGNQITSIQQWLNPQNEGGLVAQGGTPTGCVLQYANSGSAPSGIGNMHDAYSYLSNLASTDTLATCRKNYVILVTDGEPNGPGDDGTCGTSACGAANPTTSGCTCKSILAAYNLYHTLGVRSYIVGFGTDTSGSATLGNMALAGHTCSNQNGSCAYQASDEISLTNALQAAIYDAAQGEYATSPPTIGTQSGATVAGNVVFLTSAEFPSFNGHLRAMDAVHTIAGNATPMWDAGQILASTPWNTRRVFTSDPAHGHALVPFLQSNGTPNAAAIYALGVGASQTEASNIIAWSLGLGRSWVLGPLLNSTPVAEGDGISINLPGHQTYVQGHINGRPKMVYAASDDQMLHAFYLETDTAESATAGVEAWAYVPPNLLPNLAALYARGGQSQNPTQHLYGIASSPKINDVCTGACATPTDWHTIMVVPEGAGGADVFALDLTNNPNSATPFNVLWHTIDSTTMQNTIGEAWSVPAYAFASVSGSTQSWLMFGSGYDDSTTGGFDQGNYFSTVNAFTGAIVAQDHLAQVGTPPPVYTVLADTVVAMDFTAWNMIAGYQVDMGGRLWRFTPTALTPTTPFYNAGTTHPFYYSPAVAVTSGNNVALAMVDSTYDDLDMNPLAGGAPTPNITMIIDQNGTIGGTGVYSQPLTAICSSACHARSCTGCPTFTSTARPVSSPVLLKNTASGATANFQAIFLIYQPATTACSQGFTSMVVMDIVGNPAPVIQSVVTGKPVNIGGSRGRREATGRGISVVCDKATEYLGIPTEGCRVIIQGFGNVGSNAAKLLFAKGYTVVGIAEYDGGLWNPAGIDVEALLRHTAQAGTVTGFSGAEPADSGEVLTRACEILIPAATENVITSGNAEKLQCRILCEGANGPTTILADEILAQKSVFVVPDILANAGGVTASYFEWVQDRMGYFWTEAEVNDRLDRIMTESFADVISYAQQHGVNNRIAAYMLAVDRVAYTTKQRGLYA